MSSLCIVGHGQSMTGSKRGAEIDKHEVLRMKKGYMLVEQFPDDYGTRTDYAGATTAALADTIKGIPNAKEYWGYIKAKYRDEPKDADDVEYNIGKPVIIPRDLHFDWLERYYDFRGSDELRFSTGTGLILIALDRLKPEILVLAGFDSISDPDHSEHQSVDWSPQLKRKDYDWEKAPPHDYRCEHRFLFGPIQSTYTSTQITIMP